MKHITLAVLAVLALASIVFGQEIQNLLNPGIPKTLALSELTDDYKAYTISLIGNRESTLERVMFGSITTPMTPDGGTSNFSPPGLMILLMSGAQWSKGQELRIGGETFLATYKLVVDSTKQGSVPAPPITEMLHFELELIRVSQIASVSFHEKMTAASVRNTLGLTVGVAREASHRTQSINNLKQIALGTILYSTDYDDVLPSATSSGQAQELIMPYIKSRSTFQPPYGDKTVYLFNVRLSGKTLTSIEEPAETPMWYESRPNGDPPGRAVARTDGSVKRLTEPEFQELAKRFRLVTTYK